MDDQRSHQKAERHSGANRGYNAQERIVSGLYDQRENP
jgi:hypothetical protein